MCDLQGVASLSRHITTTHNDLETFRTVNEASAKLREVVQITKPRRDQACRGSSIYVLMAEQGSGDQPSDQRPPPYAGPFLFVNKNATNLRSRQREEVFAVRSHAMQIARRSRKPTSQAKSQDRGKRGQPDADDVGSSSTSARSDLAVPEEASSVRDVLQQQTMGMIQDQQRRFQTNLPTQSRRSSTDYRGQAATSPFSSSIHDPTLAPLSSRLPTDQAALVSQLIAAPSPTGTSPGPSVPLTTSPAPSDTFFNSVLQFWRVAFLSNFWPARIYLDPAHGVVQSTNDWIRTMVNNNPALLHGLFSGSLSYVTNYLPATSTTPLLWGRAIHHHGRCLEATRSQLSRPGVGAEESLSLIYGMSTFSFHCQDLESCQLHRTAVMRMLNNLDGGLDSIHPVLKYVLILGDALIAGHTPRRPQLRISEWAPPSWHQETSLRSFDHAFNFDPDVYEQGDRAVFLINSFGMEEQYETQLLQLIKWHREALAANEIAAALSVTSTETSPSSGAGVGGDDGDPIYAWLSLRQHALTCYSTDLLMDIVEIEDFQPPLELRLRRVFHVCMLLGTNYLFQFVMRRDTQAPSMAYIPYQHLRTQVELLMTLMSQHRRREAQMPRLAGPVRQAANPIPTDALLFLFFVGALVEETDGKIRQAGQRPLGGPTVPPVLGTSNAPTDLIAERWFNVHFAMVLQRLNIEIAEDAKLVLQRFLYSDRVLDTLLQSLVARKLDFLTALVASAPNAPTLAGLAMTGDQGRVPPARHHSAAASLPTSATRQAPIRITSDFEGTTRPPPMPPPAAIPPPIQQRSQSLSAVPQFIQTTTAQQEAMQPTGSDWWQDMTFGTTNEEAFGMDLDLSLSLDATFDDIPGFEMPGDGAGDEGGSR
jgi:hypothetical protein